MSGSLDSMRSQVFNFRDLWVELRQEGLVINGHFNSDTVWSKGAGWTIAGSKANQDGSNGDLTQSGIVSSSNTFRVRYTISGRSAGTLTPKCGTTAGTSRSTNDTFEDVIVSNGADLVFDAAGGFDGKLDVVSVDQLLTEYWLYINTAALQDKGIVKRSFHAGAKGRRLTTISHDYTLNLSRFQAKYSDDFGIFTVAPDNYYEIKLILINDQNPSLTETHTLKHCQLESRSIRFDPLVNNVPTQWAVGEYSPPS